MVQGLDIRRDPALQWAADLLEEDAYRSQRAEQTSSFLAAAFSGVVTVLQVRLRTADSLFLRQQGCLL